MTNFEMYKNMIDSIRLEKILNLAAEEIIFAVIPKNVMSKEKKNMIWAATQVMISAVTGICKNAFLAVYKNEFTDEEFGKLCAYYGPGSTLWSFFNTNDFFPWLRQTIKAVIQKRVEGLDLASMSAGELQSLAQIGLSELLDLLPEWVKAGSTDYTGSDLCKREAALGDKITEEGNRLMSEVNWYELLEKSGILPFDED